MKQIRLSLLAVLAGAICFGCEKSAPESTSTTSTAPVVASAVSPQTASRFHWLGRKKIAASTNSASLMKIWNEPESARLQSQTLDKLSTAPWRLFPHVATTNTAAAPLLRALLDDCVDEESYVEIRHATNQPGELAFAIRLPADRAALWETNLAAVLESLTGLKTNSQLSTLNSQLPGWSLKKHELPNLIEFTRTEDWVVIGIAQDTNALLADFISRISRNRAPVTPSSRSEVLSSNPDSSAANLWVDAAVDLRGIAEAFKLNWNLPEQFPKISAQLAGDGQSVQTHAQLNFSKPLALPLEPWNLPTNLIRGYISSFTAMRGFGPWLGSQKAWTDLQLGPAPTQFFVWAGLGIPLQTLFAFPANDSTNRVAQMSDGLLRNVGPWLVTNDSGHLEKAANFPGMSWTGMPFLAPYFRAEGDFISGGVFPNAGKKSPLPAEVLSQLAQTNIVYYDWELTGPRIEAWFYVGQTLRLVLHKPQLPAASASTAWLQANTNSLGPCVTGAFESGPAQISISRRSAGVGFTAFELHLLGDWLESPQFPRGLNTLVAQPQSVRRPRPVAPVPQ